MILSRSPRQIAGFYASPENETAFAFYLAGEIWAGSDWTIQWHANAGWEIYLQIDGASYWEIEGGSRFELREGGFYLIRPKVKHRLLGFSGDVHFAFVDMREHAVPQTLLAEAPWCRDFGHGTNGAGLAGPFRALIAELSQDRPWQKELCECQLAALSYEVTRGCLLALRGDSPSRQEPGWLSHRAAARARELMESRPDYPWTIPELARICGVSNGHLIHLYRREYAETPKRALQRLRVEEACRRLRDTDQSMTEIAHDLCFSSSQHFARDFKKATGRRPSDYRQAARAGLIGVP